MEYIFWISRIIFGGYFVYSGIGHFIKLGWLSGYASSKRVPFPKFSVVLSGIMMLLGGLGVLLWAFVPLAVLLIVVFLIVTSIVMHNFWKIEDPMARANEQIAFTKNMALIGGALAFFLLAFFVR